MDLFCHVEIRHSGLRPSVSQHPVMGRKFVPGGRSYMTKQEWCELQPQRFPRRGPAGEPRMAKMVVDFGLFRAFGIFF